MNRQTLTDTVRVLVVGNKGLVAMDESNSTCNQRFELLATPQTEEARRDYRDLIVTTPNLSEYISRHRCKKLSGTSFGKNYQRAGWIAG